MSRLAALAVPHARDCVAALGKLSRQPVGTALTVLVIGIALALPAALQVMVRAGQSLSGQFATVRDFSVFLRPGVGLDEARALGDELSALDRVDGVRLIPADEAWAEFSALAGFGEAAAALDTNPLGHTLVVTPSAEAAPETLAALREELAGRDPVDLVKLDTEWIARLDALLSLVRRAVWLAALLLAGAVLVIVGNTIRLDIQQQRAEIEVAKLLGATDAFVRRPFLYLGLWYGVAGGLVAVVILLGGQALLAGPLDRLRELYGARLALAGVDAWLGFGVLAVGVLTGLGGALTAVARQLGAIEPRL